MKKFNSCCNSLIKTYSYIGVMMLVIISAAGILQVFTRYILGNSITGSEELSRYCFIWLGFTGSAVCVQKWSNAHVSILNDALKGKWKNAHSVFLSVMVLICAVVLFYQGIKCVNIAAHQRSSMLHISMSMVYAAIPVGSFGMMLASLQRIFNLLSPQQQEAKK